MHSSPITRVRHVFNKTAVACLVAFLIIGVTYESSVTRGLVTTIPNKVYPVNRQDRILTAGTVHAAEGGVEFGSALEIVGAVDGLFSALYYGLDKSYIDKYYGGSVAGYMLAMVLDPEEAEFDYIDNQLKVIIQKLNHLIALDRQILNAIQALATQLSVDVKELEEAIEAGALDKPEKYILAFSSAKLLTKYQNTSVKKITSTDRSYIQTTCKNILYGSSTPGWKNKGDLDEWLTTINTHMTPAGPINVGLINLLAQQIHIDSNGKEKNLYDYYQLMESYILKYILLQSKGMNLYVECAHALKVKSSKIKSQYLLYLGNIVSQLSTFRNAVEETVVLNSNYTVVRAAFNPWSGSTTGQSVPSGSSNILPRVDFVTDQVLGGTNLTQLTTSPGAFLQNPRGALTARVLSAKDQYRSGYKLNFAYAQPLDKPPSIPACPKGKGLQRTKVWTLANASPDRFIITTLAGWQAKQKTWAKAPAQANDYLGSPSYQLAVSTTSLNSGEVGTVGLCASAGGAKQKDGSLFLAYHLLPPGTQKPGPTETIGWHGTGTVGTSKYTPDRFTVDTETNTITIKGLSYTSEGTGTATMYPGLPYLQWSSSTITGQNSSYKIIRYDFPNVPRGDYEVTGPSGEFLLPLTTGEGVYLYNRQFNVISPDSRDMVLATSTTLRTWENFTLENYHLSKKNKSALGKLKAANGKYVVAEKDSKGQTHLVANSADGQEVAFVGWTKSDMKDTIVNWGHLQIGKEYVNVSSQTQQITLVGDSKEATKFKITLIDKGKAALEEGKSYKVSLTYGIVNDLSPVKCPSLVPLQDGNPQNCFQYYLFADIGYPYGYFTYSPLAAAGGFGKNLGLKSGGSPFSSWTFAETRNVVEGCPENGGKASAGAYSDKPGVWGEITSKSQFGESCVSAGVMAANVAIIRLGSHTTSSTAGCEYAFTISIYAKNSWDFQWNGQDDHDKLTHKEVFLRFNQGDLSQNPWPTTTIKELSMEVSGNSASERPWLKSGDLSFSKAKNGDVLSILYGLYLVYEDHGLFMSVYPKFTLDTVFSVQLNLSGISGKNCQIGQD